MELLAAFTIGLLGSLHCIGMCGPIALALPVPGGGVGQRVLAATVYNIGRATTYSLLGVALGGVGRIVALAGFEQTFSIGLGIFILLLVIVPVFMAKLVNPPAIYRNTLGKLQAAMSNELKKHGVSTLFVLGILNGLLPCGFVYIALAGAASTGNWYMGAAYMALFGLGTLPLMTALILVKNRISLNLRRTLGKAMPYAMVVIGVLFILRGMNLGIPYVSPQAKPAQGQYINGDTGNAGAVNCH